jgi:hypothetical protein
MIQYPIPPKVEHFNLTALLKLKILQITIFKAVVGAKIAFLCEIRINVLFYSLIP